MNTNFLNKKLSLRTLFNPKGESEEPRIGFRRMQTYLKNTRKIKFSSEKSQEK
jgi:hypothetical protein